MQDQIFLFVLGAEAVLNATGAGIGGSYDWDGGITDGVMFEPAATATYTVIGTDDNGCVSTDDVLVTVIPLPIVEAGADQEICFGESAVLNGAGAGAGGTYEWDGGIADGIYFTPDETNIYTVTATTIDGCVNSDDVMVIVNPLPAVNFMGDNLIGCAPLRVEFSSLGDGSEFYWEFGDGTNDVGIDPVHVYTVTGLYTVTLTATSAEGCINSETYESYVDVENTPVAQFNYSPYEIDVSDTRVELANNSLYATTYEWDFGDGSANTGEVSPSHEYPVEGDVSYRISLTATSDNGCVDIAEQVIRINDKLIYYIPNTFTPDGDTFNETFTPVFASGLDIFDYHIMIFNRWGELVFESYDANFGWNGMYGDQGLVEDGVYIYKIEFGETMTDKKHYIEGHVVLLK